MGIVTGFALLAGLHIAAGISGHVLHGKPRGHWVPLALAMLGLPLPHFLPEHPSGLRFLCGLGAAMGLLRAIDLARDKTPRPILFRVRHIMTAFDTRRMKKGTAHLMLRRAVLSVLVGLLILPGLYAVYAIAPALSGTPALLVRWAFGLLFAYASSDLVYGGAFVLFRALGVELEELHRAPILSRTVKEFWGERWNRTVSAWLSEHILRPFARRRQAKLGLLASFVVSAVLHGYLVLVTLGDLTALLMSGYFLVQGALVFVEIRLRATRWSRPVGHVWTVTVMVATSPLFVEPALRCIGI